MYAVIAPVSRRPTSSMAARLARATSATCTKSRIWPPSSKTRGASPRSSEERKIAATPEYGVSRGMPGPVDVVVPQRDRRGVALPGPRGRVVLLGDLAGGVAAARVEPRGLVDQLPAQRLAAGGAVVVEVAGLERRDRPGRRRDRAVRRAGVAALAVDDHRRGEHQPADAAGGHRGQQRGGAEVVVGGVRRAGRPPWCPHRPARPGGRPRRRRRAGRPSRAASRTSSTCRPSTTGGTRWACGSSASTSTTSWPAASSSRRIAPPMNPAAPVSRTLMGRS